MKDAVRPRNDNPGQRSLNRQHWHEDDERDKRQRRKFWIHIVFDLLLIAATAYFARDYFTKPFRDDITKLEKKIGKLEKKIEAQKPE